MGVHLGVMVSIFTSWVSYVVRRRAAATAAWLELAVDGVLEMTMPPLPIGGRPEPTINNWPRCKWGCNFYTIWMI